MKDIAILEKFIANDLSKEEHGRIKKLIDSNQEVAQELQFRMEVNEAIMENDVMNLREKLVEIHSSFQKSKVTQVRQLITKRWHLVAASVTILIMIGSFLFSNLNTPTTDQLFDKYYSVKQVCFTNRSVDTENLQLTTALEKMHNKDFDNAINLLTPFKNNQMAQFFLGLSFMETKQYSNAQNSFQNILDLSNNIYTEQAEWYNALCLLKLEDKDGAKKQLSIIIEEDNLYSENAMKILRNLK